MRVRVHCMVVPILLLVAGLAPAGAPSPSVTVDYPPDGTVLLQRNVTVNGTASGSETSWIETMQQEFEAGTGDGIVLDPSGELYLCSTIYDDFEDGAIDPARWSQNQAEGITAAETGGELRIGGMAAGQGCYTSYCSLVSAFAASDRVSAAIVSFSADIEAWSGVGFYQDEDNFIVIGQALDINVQMDPFAALVYRSAGCETLQKLQDTGKRSVSLVRSGQDYKGYVDGQLLATQRLTLSQPKCALRGAVRWQDNTLNAAWDDVRCYYVPAGAFSSGVYDTCSDQPVFKKVLWAAVVPADTQLTVRVRSAAVSDIGQGVPWSAPLLNAQASGLPALARYLQYRLELASDASGNSTPVFQDLNLTYRNAVAKVEVSADNRTSWRTAAGKEAWSVQLELAEGPGQLWVRVTDVDGNVKIVSQSLGVDTTPPAGSIRIGDGETVTLTPEVTLYLAASDAYGVKQMKLCETAELFGAEWRPFASSVRWNLSAGDGDKTIYAAFRDPNGLESAVASASITLDTKPPAGSVLMNDGAAFTRSTSVRLELNASDAVGVTEMLLAGMADFKDAIWEDWQPEYSWELSPGDGNKTVWAKFRDLAGHESPAYNASIILDTAAPELYLSIGSGEPYARSRAVTLGLEATDNYEVTEMLIGASPDFPGAGWEPFSAARCWTLPEQQGLHSIYARARDRAGNEGPVASASVYLDSVLPLCVVSSMPSSVTEAAFTVRWNGSDTGSGVARYDVQYKDGEGPWTDWQTNINSTSALFTGGDNHTYYFRARAVDNAGNPSPYPDRGAGPVTVRIKPATVPLPQLRVVQPTEKAKVSGKVMLNGTARQDPPGAGVSAVQLRIDSGDWLAASGTANWSFEWDTTEVKNGPHQLSFRAYDGRNYSAVAFRNVTVDNLAPAAGGDGSNTLLMAGVAVIAAAAGAAAVVLVLGRRRPPATQTEGQRPLAASPPPDAAPTEAQEPLAPRSRPGAAASLDEQLAAAAKEPLAAKYRLDAAPPQEGQTAPQEQQPPTTPPPSDAMPPEGTAPVGEQEPQEEKALPGPMPPSDGTVPAWSRSPPDRVLHPEKDQDGTGQGNQD